MTHFFTPFFNGTMVARFALALIGFWSWMSIEVHADEPLQKKELVVGVDANYSLGMEKEGARWKWNGNDCSLFEGMVRHGVTDLRIRLWTRDDGANGRDYATELVRQSLKAGLHPYLVIFLSDDWADLMKQPIPAAWKDLNFEERKVAVQDYSRDVVAHFRKVGLQSHLYEIGNEIDYGICGEYPGKSSKKDPESLKKRLWPRTAQLILASQAGVRQSDPEAKFLLHISHWWDAEFCKEFFRFMIDQGVQLDYAGLSYFPTANIGGSLQMNQFADTVTSISAAIQRPIMIPETAYPSTRAFKGQFSRWKYEVLGYPLSTEGQKQWLSDFLTMCHHHPDIHSVYYWSPEWYGEGMWKGFALFETDGQAKPAWHAFHEGAQARGQSKRLVYYELAAGRIHKVPVDQAQKAIKPVLERLSIQTGGVNTDYIKRLDETELLVDSYQVVLRGSLMNNLHLQLYDANHGTPLELSSDQRTDVIQELFAEIDASTERLVFAVRADSAAMAIDLANRLQQHGLDVTLHPKEDEAPLKFGLE